MRIETINCKDRRTAKRRAVWACKIVKARGGFIAFESWSDYHTWQLQE